MRNCGGSSPPQFFCVESRGSADNTLDGFLDAGHDTLIGGDGNDTYIVHLAADVATERTLLGLKLSDLQDGDFTFV